MNNILALIIIVFVVAGFLWFLDREAKRRDRAEKERFREFVIAAKTDRVEDYLTAIPEEGNLPSEGNQDELVELDEVDPETLLKAIKKQ